MVTFCRARTWSLLESLAGYIGIAIQNAQLYRRLEQKIQRLRAAAGLQREHCGVDQYWRVCGGSE